jgi:hypothetical protein
MKFDFLIQKMIFLKRSKKYLAGTFNSSNKSRIIHFNNIIYYFICDWRNAFYGKDLFIASNYMQVQYIKYNVIREVVVEYYIKNKQICKVSYMLNDGIMMKHIINSDCKLWYNI